MTLQEKIQNVITNLTAGEIDEVTFDDLRGLSNKQIELYIARACQLNRNYFYALVIDDGSDEYVRRYGTFTSWVEFNEHEKKWTEMSDGGLIPGYYKQPPIMMTKEKFTKEAEKLGIPHEAIERIGMLPIEN